MMKEDNLPDFTDKVLSVYINGPSESKGIAYPRFQEQGGRLFLVGVVPETSSLADWVKGHTCAIAWDSITDYLVFDSEEQYVERVAIYDAADEEED